MIVPASSQPHHDSILRAFPFGQLEWELTPPAVQDYLKSQHQQIAQLQSQMTQLQSQIEQLQQHVETLQGRMAKTSQTSSKPPSSDSPFNKPKRQGKTSTGTRGGQKGHRGRGPTLLSPTEVHLIEPGPCPCGHGHRVALTPYYTHQVIELRRLRWTCTISSCSRASAKDVASSAKRRCQVTIRPVMGPASVP